MKNMNCLKPEKVDPILTYLLLMVLVMEKATQYNQFIIQQLRPLDMVL